MQGENKSSSTGGERVNGKKTYTKEEVIEMLKDMQIKTCHTTGFIY